MEMLDKKNLCVIKRLPFFVILSFMTLLLLMSCNSLHKVDTPANNHKSELKEAVSRDQILNLVSEGNTGEALHLLIKAGNADAVLFQANFDMAQDALSKGIITYDDWALIQARTNYAILETVPKEEKGTNTVSIQRDQIKKLTDEGKLEDALRLLFQTEPEGAAMLLSRIHTAQKYYKLGIISLENMNQISAQINFGILYWIK